MRTEAEVVVQVDAVVGSQSDVTCTLIIQDALVVWRWHEAVPHRGIRVAPAVVHEDVALEALCTHNGVAGG